MQFWIRGSDGQGQSQHLWVAIGLGYPDACFFCDQNTGSDIPGVDTGLPIAIKATSSNIA